MHMSRQELDGWLAALKTLHRPTGRGRKGGRHDDTPDTPPQKTFKSRRRKRSTR